MTRWEKAGWVLLFSILLTLFGCMIAGAQDQVLQPDGEDNPTDVFTDACTTACNAAACDDDVDEGQGSADGLEVSTTTQNATIQFDFPTPSSAPGEGASAQAFDLVMSRCDDDASCTERTGGTDPAFSAEVRCNGTIITGGTLFSGQAITTTDQLHTGTWTFNTTDCASDGSDVQVFVTLTRAGGGANRNYACIEAIDWDVTWAAVAEEMMVIGR